LKFLSPLLVFFPIELFYDTILPLLSLSIQHDWCSYLWLLSLTESAKNENKLLPYTSAILAFLPMTLTIFESLVSLFIIFSLIVKSASIPQGPN